MLGEVSVGCEPQRLGENKKGWRWASAEPRSGPSTGSGARSGDVGRSISAPSHPHPTPSVPAGARPGRGAPRFLPRGPGGAGRRGTARHSPAPCTAPLAMESGRAGREPQPRAAPGTAAGSGPGAGYGPGEGGGAGCGCAGGGGGWWPRAAARCGWGRGMRPRCSGAVRAVAPEPGGAVRGRAAVGAEGGGGSGRSGGAARNAGPGADKARQRGAAPPFWRRRGRRGRGGERSPRPRGAMEPVPLGSPPRGGGGVRRHRPHPLLSAPHGALRGGGGPGGAERLPAVPSRCPPAAPG